MRPTVPQKSELGLKIDSVLGLKGAVRLTEVERKHPKSKINFGSGKRRRPSSTTFLSTRRRNESKPTWSESCLAIWSVASFSPESVKRFSGPPIFFTHASILIFTALPHDRTFSFSRSPVWIPFRCFQEFEPNHPYVDQLFSNDEDKCHAAVL